MIVSNRSGFRRRTGQRYEAGGKTVKVGKLLKVQYGVTNAAAITAHLKGKKNL